MSFSIDKQSLEELNLLGKFKSGSVYHLFNQVKTRGGEQLLDEMFHSPLQDALSINQRAGVFQVFQEARLHFPFDPQQLAQMREYLDTAAGNNMILTWLNTIIKKTLSNLTKDERYKKQVQGLQATIVTLNKCAALLKTLPSAMGPFSIRIEQVKELLSDKELVHLSNVDIYGPLPVNTLAFFDHALKNKYRQQMEDLLAFIYELDVNIAVSGVARSKGFAYAKALPAKENILEAVGLYHPAIEGAIGNTISMHQDNNVLFLTGANMAGKSTLMKSIGISMYLAHMGFPVAATQMEFSLREGLYSSINVSDSIHLGYSHFYAEVVRVKQAAEATSSGKRLLLMFDELFKGTNVKDAYDGTLAVTQAFASYRDCLFIVSTHIIEVGEALKNNDNIHFGYMPTVMDGNRPRYTYTLEAGITEDRQGMMIIRNERIVELIGG